MDVEYWLHGICFEWNREKATVNVRKHGVTFEEACEVFFDPSYVFSIQKSWMRRNGNVPSG